jgi:hypothetical protein
MGLVLLTTASMPLKYWEKAFLTTTYSINHTPTKLLDLMHLFIIFLALHQTTHTCVLLVVPAGQIYALIIITNFNIIMSIVHSLAIVICTKSLSALTFGPFEFISPVMSYLMKLVSHLLTFILLQATATPKKFTFYLLHPCLGILKIYL